MPRNRTAFPRPLSASCSVNSVRKGLGETSWLARIASTTVVSSSMVIAGCGSAPPTVAPPPTHETPETSTVATPNAPDLSPVSEPKNVVLFARGNDVQKSVTSIDRVLKLPKPLKTLVDAAMSEKNASFINLAASFDVAVVLDPQSTDKDPKFLWAVSIPLTSVDAAAEASRKDGDEVRSSTVGAYRSRSKSGTVCDITPSAGDSPARAVCSDDEEGLRELSPWLARGVPMLPKKPADLWLRADAAPLKERYMAFLKGRADEALGDLVKEARALPSLDQELLDVPSILSHEAFAFGEDADSIEMSFALDPNKPEIRLVGTLGFKSRTSWLTELIARGSERAEPPPDQFFRMPKDAMTATWARAADPAMFTGIRRVVHKAAAVGLGFAPMLNDADKRSFIAWIDEIPSFSGMWVSSSGGPTYKPELKGKLTAAQAVDEAKEMARHYLPWGISGGEGDPAQMVEWMKQSADTWGRGVAVIKKEAGKHATKDLALLPTVKEIQNPPGYPKGSAALDIAVKFSSKDVWELLPQNKYREQSDGKWGRPEHPKGAEAHGDLTLRFVVVPDEPGHYWFGYSVDPDVLKKHILAAQKGAPTAGTLAARADLGLLKSHKGFGGFFSYGTLIDSLKNAADLSANDARDMNDIIQAMPHKGQSPLFFLGSGTPGTAPTITFEIVAQKDWVEDMSAATEILAKKVLRDKDKPTTSTVPPSPPAPPVSPPRKRGP